MKFPLLFCFSVLVARADSLSDLKTTLAKFDGQDSVRAAVEYSSAAADDDGGKSAPVAAKVAAKFEAGADGLRVFWDRDTLQRATDEARSTDSKHPIRQAMGALGAVTLMDLANGAPQVLRELAYAELVGEKPDTSRAGAARLLSFKLSPPMSEKDRKYIKQFESTAQVWVDAAGVPVAAESRMHLKGRAMLVISFESSVSEGYEFKPIGRRLVVTRHVREESGSGGGESGHQKATTLVTVQ